MIFNIYTTPPLLFDRLIGDVLLSTAFLSYSGPFNQDFRMVLNESWMKETKTRKIPFTTNLNITDMLTDTTTVSFSSILYIFTIYLHK